MKQMVKAFNKMTSGTKIMTCHLLMLMLVGTVGGLAIFRLNQINFVVNDLAGNLAVNQHLSGEIGSHSLLFQLYARRYINQKDPTDLDRYQEEMDKFQELLIRGDERITKPEQAAILAQIKTKVEEYRNKFAETTNLLAERQQVRSKVLDTQAQLAEEKLDQLWTSAFETDDAVALYHIGNAQQAFTLMRMDVFQYLDEADEQWVKKIKNRYQEVQAAFDQLATQPEDSTQRRLAAKAEANIAVYYEGFESLRSDSVRLAQITAALHSLGSQLHISSSQLSAGLVGDSATKAEISDGLVGQTQVVMLAIMIMVVIMGFGLGAIINQAVKVQLAHVPKLAMDVIAGILNLQDVSSKDGAGVLAAAISQVTGNPRERLQAEAELRKN
jgi:hypothetical protein